jgi:hypothetical protein
VTPPERCRGARLGVVHYRTATHDWQAKRELAGRAGPGPLVRSRSCHWARYAVDVWRARARAARLAFDAWFEHNFAWRSWLPANWYAVAVCESGHDPPNWQHDSGTYVSAFGIFRPGYIDDAHRIGNRSWDETLRELGRYPTPREQYDAAVSHFEANGDGWGCPGP